MDQQECLDADQPDQHRGGEADRDIGRHGAEPRAPARAHEADGQPMLQEKQIGGTDAEHDQRMPVQPIAQPGPQGTCAIFLDRECVDVTDAATVEISSGGMVRGVGTPPQVVRREGQHAEHATEPGVGQPMPEEGAVAAIVLDEEQSHHEGRGGHGKRQRQPIADVERGPGQHPECHQRQQRYADLDQAAAGAGLPVACQKLRPKTGILGCRGACRRVLVDFPIGLTFLTVASRPWRLRKQRAKWPS